MRSPNAPVSLVSCGGDESQGAVSEAKRRLSDQRYITELLEDLCENSHSAVSKYVMSESAEEQRRFAVSGGWEGDSLTSWPMRFTRNPSPYLTCLVSLRVWCNIFRCFALSPGRASLKSARVCYTAKSGRRKYGASKHNSLMKLFCKNEHFLQLDSHHYTAHAQRLLTT